MQSVSSPHVFLSSSVLLLFSFFPFLLSSLSFVNKERLIIMDIKYVNSTENLGVGRRGEKTRFSLFIS